MKLLISKIRTDGGTQPREAISLEVVDTYQDAMQEGAKFPPIDVFYDGTHYWLADGFHRRKAAYQADLEEIDCIIHQGTVEDAQWFSFGANKSNGLYRSNKDKERAVKSALKHSRCVGLSDNAISKHVGTDHKTVAAWRAKLELSREIPKIAERSVIRNGIAYQQDTANIGNGTLLVKDPAMEPAPISVSIPPTAKRRFILANALKDKIDLAPCGVYETGKFLMSVKSEALYDAVSLCSIDVLDSNIERLERAAKSLNQFATRLREVRHLCQPSTEPAASKGE